MPAIVAVVVVVAVWYRWSVVVVRSFAKQAHPFGAVAPVAPASVMTAVQVPDVPDTNEPAEAPPLSVEVEHPEIVAVVPLIWIGAVALTSPAPLGESAIPMFVSLPMDDSTGAVPLGSEVTVSPLGEDVAAEVMSKVSPPEVAMMFRIVHAGGPRPAQSMRRSM